MSESAISALEARICELETQLAFQDDLFRRLDEAVARQDLEVLQLKGQLKAVGQRLSELRDAAPGSSEQTHEVPPHY